MIRVLIVDDILILCQGLKAIFNCADGYILKEMKESLLVHHRITTWHY